MAAMSEAVLAQGRCLQAADMVGIRRLIADNPTWSRRRISEALATAWDWRNGRGQLKDMAARSLLVKLEARGLIDLPARRQTPTNRMGRVRRLDTEWDTAPVVGPMGKLGPLQVQEIHADPAAGQRCAAALDQFHYLGWGGAVGENLRYTITNEAGRLLACIGFGSAAWKCRARDEFIGWNARQKQQRLHLITNNTRFLILPFVQVPHLASWILGQVLRRLSSDWEARYGHGIVLVETFVDRERFRGTCYRAANWTHTGATTGRSRQDRQHRLRVPIKDVYIYPLARRFRQELSA
jgi:hypothetical protein